MAEDAADPPPMEEVWSPPVPDPSKDPENEIRAIARKLSEQPVLNPEPGVWAVLTAISKNARQRPQGINIILSADEHCLGRCVEDLRFQVGEITVSAYHCRIFRERKATVDDEQDPSLSVSVFLKDTSTNGTFLNWEKLRRRSPKAKLCHGDIISFSAPPHEANSYAFVYREVRKPTSNVNGSSLKRKSEDLAVENKRQKGIGIGAPDGPISLDDVRSLQRSNTELRQQLEAQVRTIETTRCEYRACVTRHENDLKEMKDTLSSSFLDQIKDLRTLLDGKQKELDELNSSSAQLRQSIKDLNERLTVSMQSRSDADEIIQSQKAIISELESQLDEERNQRREEREKAAIDLKSALQKVHSEAQEEIKRQADVYLRQHKEQQEVINKLQESEKESRLLVETLRSKLEDARENLVVSEKRVRHLEVQLQDEQTTSAKSKKKSETLDLELKRLRKELENEKVAREEAWAKVSALELEIAAAIRDLSIEKQRFQGARERIILRETQLRAFYSTTEEISSLFAKQQEQLKAMQKTLEDEENCDAASFGINLNELPTGNPNMAHVNARDTREASGACTPKNARTMCGSSHDDDDDDASVTEKHNCDPRSHEGNTQDLECTSADRLVEEIGADMGGISTAVVPDGGLMDTECIVETESPACDASFHLQNAALNKCRDLAGDTVQLDDEAQVQCKSATPSKQLEERNYPGSQSRIEDTQPVTIRTTDLLASEVAGSWAISTAPSVHGENESPKSAGHGGVGGEAADAATLVPCSEGQVEGSQSNAKCPGAKVSAEHQALNVMIEIMAPNLRQRLSGGSSFHVERNDSMSDAETEGSNHSPEGVNETQNANGSDGGGGDDDDDARSLSTNNTVEDDTEDAEENSDDMIEDSVG